MSLFLRDPLVRELLYNDYERDRALRPFVRQPIRVHRVLNDDWPLMPHNFDHALSELQNVMDNVHEAIGNVQSLTRDVGVGGMKTTRTEDGHLQVAIDCSQYKPEEINVKICDDNLVVEAKTESSQQDSYHKSEFKRWVKLPADVKQEAIKSTLTHDKKLLIEVPLNKPIAADTRSRSIPIDVQKAPEAVADKKSGDQSQASNQKQTK